MPTVVIERPSREAATEAATSSPATTLPGGEYMNQDQLNWFERFLMGMRSSAIDAIRATQEDMQESEVIADISDKATSIEAGSLATAKGDRLKMELRRIDEALSRIRSGDYGYCIDTGDEIGLARLMANPTACRTIEAQQAVELRQRMRAN